MNSRLRGTNFIRTTYSELIGFSFLEVCSVVHPDSHARRSAGFEPPLRKINTEHDGGYLI